MVVDYQNGKIYKLWSPSNEGLIYIGSTTQNLSMRKGGHSKDFKKWQNRKRNFVTSFTVLECEDNRIDLLEAYPCSNKMELLKREGYWIKKINCLNKNIAGRTPKDYREDNKEEISKKQKSYREKNKEKILEKQKSYREANKEGIKKYYEKNKEEISTKRKEKITCDCGSIVTKCHLERHKKTEKHLSFFGLAKLLEVKCHQITCDCGSTLRKDDLERHKKTEKHLYFLEHGKLPEIKGKKITCECGSSFCKNELSRHEKTKKHLTFVESQKKEKEYVKIIFIA